MKQTFRRIGENFYQRSYMTVRGERVKYYAVFTDWRGIRRRFALGSDKQLARQRLRIRLGSNAKETDFDIERKQKLAEKERLTLSQWGAIYFGEIIQPDKRSLHWQKRMFTKLESRLGNMFLDDIDESVLDSYKNTRLREPIVKGRTVLKGTKVSFSTVNRELAILRTLLRQAKRWKQIKTVPEFILESEKSRKRNRIASQEEYEALLAIMERHDQRLLIGHYETAMRASELLKLTWDKVSEKDGFIRLKAADTKEKRPRSVPFKKS